nr:hypothetical protein [uncultured Flavobacterium sp.]
MKKKILLGISLLLVIISLGLVYLYSYKAHRDISLEKVDYVVTISGLEREFTANERSAYTKYQNKIIELTATVSAIDPTSKGIVLGGKVFATFKDSLPKKITSGKTLKIKGRFLGYDELLDEFKIDQSSVTH